MTKIKISDTSIISVMILSLLFFYVYQKVQIFRFGYKIRDIEKEIGVLEKDNSFLQLKISSLVSPERIEREIKRYGLDLIPPKGKQIIRVK